MVKMLITIFTPTYNRGHLISKVYDSLCQQTYKDFEWVVVDDGSTDDTAEFFRQLEEGKVPFAIRYFRQVNGGKHRAVNRGIRESKGELFLILDSDDTLPPDSLETITKYYAQVRDDNAFGGVCGFMAHHDGTVIGRGNNGVILDTNSIELRYRHNIQGDMCEVFRTSVLREFPFPEIKDERFCPEVLVWNRIATKYFLRVFPEVIYLRDYLDGGLTDKIIKIRMQSPIASMMTYAELTTYDISFLQKVKSAINYWRFRLCSTAKDKPQLAWQYHWAMPFGAIMHIIDQYKVRKQKGKQ